MAQKEVAEATIRSVDTQITAMDKEVALGRQMGADLDLTTAKLEEMKAQAGVTPEQWQSAIDEVEESLSQTNDPTVNFRSSDEKDENGVTTLTCAARLELFFKHFPEDMEAARDL